MYHRSFRTSHHECEASQRVAEPLGVWRNDNYLSQSETVSPKILHDNVYSCLLSHLSTFEFHC